MKRLIVSSRFSYVGNLYTNIIVRSNIIEFFLLFICQCGEHNHIEGNSVFSAMQQSSMYYKLLRILIIVDFDVLLRSIPTS
jgi:hypothetical protein